MWRLLAAADVQQNERGVMELEVEELNALKRKLKITVPQEVVSKKVSEAYRELNRKIRIPGFRPGKIPLKILEKQVPVQALGEVFQNLMQEYYEKALTETGIIPAGAPEIDHEALKEVKKDAPLDFSVILDIKPKITLPEYRGMKLKKKDAKVSDEEMHAAIRDMLAARGHFEPYDEDHAIQKEDHVVIDFEGTLRDEPLEQGSSQRYPVCIGEEKMIPGFEDQLIGHNRGEEFSIKVLLPADWNKKLRRVSMPIPGAEKDEEQDVANFKVKVHEVKKLILPDLTDDFAQGAGAESVSDLRRKVKIDLQAFKEQQQEMALKEEIFNKLVEVGESDSPPESLVNQEIQFLIEGMKFQIEQSGMKLEDSGFDENRAQKEMRNRAEKNVKGYMLLDAIADQEKIHVSESDMDQEYALLAQQTKQKLEDVKKRLQANPESFNQTKSKLRGQKTLNFIFSNCEFEYVKSEDKPVEKLDKDPGKKDG
ncbi:MAG: trigger factor [Nitrospinota bacterium]|nr:trigger factor [Nitrospinota bacterium]